MGKYIERGKAIKAIEQLQDCYNGFSNTYDKACIIGVLEEVPPADVVEVVRCADCKWFQCNMRKDGYLPRGVSEYECRSWCGEVDPTDYCSRCERIE